MLRVALLDDLTAPCGHSPVQQALTNAVRLCGCQLRDVVYDIESQDLNTLTVTFKLNITLKNRPSAYDFNPITHALSFPIFNL